MQISSTEKIIEDLIHATQGEGMSTREQYVLRQALHGLARQARIEQMAEMRANVEKMTGTAAMTFSRHHAKILLKRVACRSNGLQQQFEFDLDDDTV